VKDWSGRNVEKSQCFDSPWNTDSVIKSGAKDSLVMKEKRKYWSENSREADCLKHLSVERRLIKNILWKTGLEIFSGFSWLNL
jgi:hypothetical protein